MARLPRNLVLLGVASLLTDASTEAVFPLLPLFITSLGGGGLAVGAMEGLAESIASFLKLASGRLSDHWQRRKGLTIAGYALSAAAKLGYAAALLPLHVVLLRAGDRLGKGIRGAPRDALIADSVAPTRRGAAFGLHRAMDTAGAFLGPLAALALLPVVALRGIFLLATIPAVAALAVLAAVREPAPATRAPRLRLGGAGSPVLTGYLLSVAVLTMANFGYLFLLLRGAEAGFGASGLLAIQLAHTAVYALLAFPLGAITDRIGRPPLVAGAFLLVALGNLLAVPTGPATFAALLPAAVAFGAANAAFEGNGRALAVDLARPQARGTVLGLYHATIGFAALPAGVLGGLLWGVRPSLAFLAAALFALAATLEFAWLWARGQLRPPS